MDLHIQIKNGKFNFGLFKRDSFAFSIVRLPEDESSNVPSGTVYSVIAAKLFGVARVSSSLISFSTAIFLRIASMSRHGVSIEKINSVLIKCFKKHQGDFNNVYQSKQ